MVQDVEPGPTPRRINLDPPPLERFCILRNDDTLYGPLLKEDLVRAIQAQAGQVFALTPVTVDVSVNITPSRPPRSAINLPG